MAQAYDTFAGDEEAGVAGPYKASWTTRKVVGVAALLLVAALGVSTVSRVNPMLERTW